MVIGKFIFIAAYCCCFFQGVRAYFGEPIFVDQVNNATVAVGRDASLQCQVENVGEYKVGWIKAGDQTVLTLHKKVITHNPRIQVTYDEQRTWTLRIAGVREEDKGCYMCQINTAVMKMQIGCISVLIPPDIRSEETSSDVAVPEGQNATLVCRASGQPKPAVKWRREDGQPFVILKENAIRGTISKKVREWKGDILTLYKTRRQGMGAFLCIASNGVPPSVSKRVVLNVNFAPNVKMRDELMGVPIGNAVAVKCAVEVSGPNPIIYWTRVTSDSAQDGPEMLHPISNGNVKYEEVKKSKYEYESVLRIRSFSTSDVGVYSCISTNSNGRAEVKMRLYEVNNGDDEIEEEELETEDYHYSTAITTRETFLSNENDDEQHQSRQEFPRPQKDDISKNKHLRKQSRGHQSRRKKDKGFFTSSSNDIDILNYQLYVLLSLLFPVILNY